MISLQGEIPVSCATSCVYVSGNDDGFIIANFFALAQQAGDRLSSLSPISFQGFRPQDFQQQDSWGYSPNQAFGYAASSHGSESASPCPATREEKNMVSVEDSSGGEEEKRIEEVGGREEGGRKGVRLNWT